MAWGPGSTYLWGYTPYLNVFCILCNRVPQDTGPDPNAFHGATRMQHMESKDWKDIFALFSGSAPDLPL